MLSSSVWRTYKANTCVCFVLALVLFCFCFFFGHMTAEDAYSNCVTYRPPLDALPAPALTVTLSHCHRSKPNPKPEPKLDDNRNGSACLWQLVSVIRFCFHGGRRVPSDPSDVHIVPNQHQFKSICSNGYRSDLAALA